MFPRPRHITQEPGRGATADTPLICAHDAALPAQGFAIRSDERQITLRYRDQLGLRYATSALAQLRRQRAFARNVVAVEDWPDFPVRGFLLDVADDRVPTRRTLRRLVEILSLSRINQLELYVQHTFAYAGHAAVWHDTSPLTPDDVAWLDAECAEQGISLVVSQNILGHMERWLQHEEYRSRAECPEGFIRDGRRLEPTTLSPTEENREFVTSLLDDVLPAARTLRVNIGADEPWELGEGVSRPLVAQKGLAAVYFDFVSRIMADLASRGYTVEFWADIFGEHPELMGHVPAGCVPVVWQYDAPTVAARAVETASDRTRRSWAAQHTTAADIAGGFRRRAHVLTEAGQHFWVAPGTSTWRAPGGRIDNAVENMIDAAEVGLEFGAEGYINTAWVDGGGYDPFMVTAPPAVFGGAVSWGLAANRGLDLAEVINRFVTHDASGITGQALMRLGMADAALGVRRLNESLLFDALMPSPEPSAEEGWPTSDALDGVDDMLRDVRDEVALAAPAALDGDDIVHEIAHTADLLRFAVRLLRFGPGGVDTLTVTTARTLLRQFETVVDGHRSVWLRRWRAGGLDDSVARLAGLRRRLVERSAGVMAPRHEPAACASGLPRHERPERAEERPRKTDLDQLVKEER